MLGKIVAKLYSEPLLIIGYLRHVHLRTVKEVVYYFIFFIFPQWEEIILCRMLNPFAVIDIVRIWNMSENIACRMIKNLKNLWALAKREMYETVEAEAVYYEVASKPAEIIPLFQNNRLKPFFLTSFCSAEPGNTGTQYQYPFH